MHNPLRTSTEQYSGQAAVSVHGFPPDSKNPKGLTRKNPVSPFDIFISGAPDNQDTAAESVTYSAR